MASMTFGILNSFVDKFKVIPNYTEQDLAEARVHIAFYPPPQVEKPPRSVLRQLRRC